MLIGSVKRSVFCKTDGSSTFWDKVDKELSSIRENANKKYPSDRNKATRDVHACVTILYLPINHCNLDPLHRSISKTLEADYELYGNPSHYGQNPVYFESESGTELAVYARSHADKDASSQRQANGQARKKRPRTK